MIFPTAASVAHEEKLSLAENGATQKASRRPCRVGMIIEGSYRLMSLSQADQVEI